MSRVYNVRLSRFWSLAAETPHSAAAWNSSLAVFKLPWWLCPISAMTYASLSSLMTRSAMMSCRVIGSPSSDSSCWRTVYSQCIDALLLVNQHAPLSHPVDPVFEVLALPEAFEHEEQPQQILVEQRDVRRVHVELRGHVAQRV